MNEQEPVFEESMGPEDPTDGAELAKTETLETASSSSFDSDEKKQ